jgi:drug/metabolite transporter (DMT)-like permease
VLIGALALLVAAGLYALASMLVKLEAPRLSIIAHNTYRLLVATLAMALIFLLTRDPAALRQIPAEALLALVAAVFCGLTVGDTLNYRAMLLIGMGRAFPIANAYPLVTLAVAALWLGEPVGWQDLAGCLLTLAGVTLVALPAHGGAGPPLDRRTNLIGIGMAAIAAVLWAGSNSFLKLALLATDPITANAVRLPLATLIAGLMLTRSAPALPPWRLPRRTLAAVVATGLVSSVIAGMLTLYGVQQVGAARASIIGATSPLFGAPLASLVLKERLTARILAGTLLAVAGIMLVV